MHAQTRGWRCDAAKEAEARLEAERPTPGSTTGVDHRDDPDREATQRQTLIGLGLNKIRRRSTLQDTPAVRGMVEKVKHLVRVIDAK